MKAGATNAWSDPWYKGFYVNETDNNFKPLIPSYVGGKWRDLKFFKKDHKKLVKKLNEEINRL